MSTRRREHALMDVNTIASCKPPCRVQLHSHHDKTIRVRADSISGGEPDVSALIPDLIWAYHTGPSDGISLLALAGLVYIGNEASLEFLLFEGRALSPRVRRTTRNMIVNFFDRRYSVLREKAMSVGVLSRTDIRLACGLPVGERAARAHREK